MILDRLEYADRYFELHPLFRRAFDFLRHTTLEDLAPGRHEIDGDRLYAMVAHGSGQRREEAKLEAHHKYIDIHVAIAGVDEMGWKSRALCTMPKGNYDREADAEIFVDTPDAWVAVGPGAFGIFFPRDAHAPMVGDGELHKVVVKIACDV